MSSSATPGTPRTPGTPDPAAPRRLPSRPHLDQYRKQAKDLRNAARSGDPHALSRLRTHLPPHRSARQTPFTLADAQLAIAREHGFSSWPRFKRHLDAQAAPVPAAPPTPAAAAPPGVTGVRDPARAFPTKEADAATYGVCLVPGIGIRPAGNPGLVAPHPVTAAHGPISVTVAHLFSGGGETDVRLDVRAMPAQADGRGAPVPITLANTAGGIPGTPIRRAWRTAADPNADGTVRVWVEAAFPALPEDAQEAFLELGGPLPLDVLTISVPVVRAGDAPLPRGRAAGGPVQRQGVSVRAAWVVRDDTAGSVTVQLVGEAAPPFRRLAGLGWQARAVRLLRAADGREFPELAAPPPLNPSGGRQHTDHVTFEGVPADVDLERAHVVLPNVTVEGAASSSVLRLSLKGLGVGDRVQLEQDVTLGDHVLGILGAEIAPPPPSAQSPAPPGARPHLLLRVDCGPQTEGVRFIGPGTVGVSVPGRDDFRRVSSYTIPGSQSLTQLRAELPDFPLDQVHVTISGPLLAIDGPWHIPLASVPSAEQQEPAAPAPTGPLPKPNESTQRALTLAVEEATRLGHTYAGTEHLLLGLLRFAGSTAVRLLRDVQVDPQRVRTAVEHVLADASPSSAPTRTGHADKAPEVTLTPRSHRVLALAASAAYHLDRRAVGTEHLLLGLILEHDGIAAAVLRSFGVTVETLRPRIQAIPYGAAG